MLRKLNSKNFAMLKAIYNLAAKDLTESSD